MNQALPSITLEYREGSSDKVYRACVEAQGGGYAVNFAYGRRGSTLSTGTKTPKPVPLEEALDVYGKLVCSKTAKGYKPAAGTQPSTGLGSSVPGVRADTGLRAQLLNPIEERDAEAYLADDAFCAQEKFDGRRMLVRKSGADISAANRDGLSTGLPDAVANALSSVAGGFVLDGECVGEVFHAFDLLDDGADLRSHPYVLRLGALRAKFCRLGDSVRVAETATGAAKRGLLAALKAGGKEGVVFKDLRAPWTAGRPATGGAAFKCKFWASCSCVVSKRNARRSVEVALDGECVGNVTVPPNHRVPAVGQVVEVRYLYVAGSEGSLYQPVYLGVRDDVPASDCTRAKQRLKRKPVGEPGDLAA
jgi:bifunctional non-homologous end joining protein LigD